MHLKQWIYGKNSILAWLCATLLTSYMYYYVCFTLLCVSKTGQHHINKLARNFKHLYLRQAITQTCKIYALREWAQTITGSSSRVMSIKAIQLTAKYWYIFQLYSFICTTSEIKCNPQKYLIARLPLPAELPCNEASLLLFISVLCP